MTKVQIHKISSYIPKYNTKFDLFSIITPKAENLLFGCAYIHIQHQSLGFKCRSERRFIREMWHWTIFGIKFYVTFLNRS